MILCVIGATFFLQGQMYFPQLIAGYIIRRSLDVRSFSPCFSHFLEKEVMGNIGSFPQDKETPIPFVETGISLMIGGYLGGVGIVSVLVLKHLRDSREFTSEAFYWIGILLALIGLISTYLNWSSAGKNTHKRNG